MKYHFVTLAALVALLSGCKTYDSVTDYISASKPDRCPDAAILATTSSLPAFASANGSDPSNVLYSIAMTDVTTRCIFDKEENTADSQLNIKLRAVRPPGGAEVTYKVPFFVAVSAGGDIVAKRLYWARVEFAAGASAADATTTVDSTIVTVASDKHVYDYHLLTGFQLTKAQLDYNNTTGRYEP